jgi:hypothetical protein
MQLALALLLERQSNIPLIPGTSSVEHLGQNLRLQGYNFLPKGSPIMTRSTRDRWGGQQDGTAVENHAKDEAEGYRGGEVSDTKHARVHDWVFVLKSRITKANNAKDDEHDRRLPSQRKDLRLTRLRIVL